MPPWACVAWVTLGGVAVVLTVVAGVEVSDSPPQSSSAWKNVSIVSTGAASRSHEEGGATGRPPATSTSNSHTVLTTPSSSLRVKVANERNVTEIMVSCPSTHKLLGHLFPMSGRSFGMSQRKRQWNKAARDALDLNELGEGGDAGLDDSPPPAADDAYSTGSLVSQNNGGLEVNLSELYSEDSWPQVVVDVEGCGQVGVAGGVPAWVRGLTFAIKGSLVLRPHWWEGGANMTDLWVRVDGGVKTGEDMGDSVGDVCHHLPPTLDTLDVSHTPLVRLTIGQECGVSRVYASFSGLQQLSVCSTTVTFLHISSNSLSGGLDEWASCGDGLPTVQYLQARNNELMRVSTCGWGGLLNLAVQHNMVTVMDLTTCPPANLTTLNAAHNYLSKPMALPPSLKYLDISHNQLTSLPDFTPALQEADLSHNLLEEIGKNKLKLARKLTWLSLAHNRLTRLLERDLAGMRRLHTLDLSHNQLEHLAPSSLRPLRHLRLLHLHQNKLTTISARDLRGLPSHVHLTAHHNPWECSCQLLRVLTLLARRPAPDSAHKAVGLHCQERGSQVAAAEVLQRCIRAVKEVTQHLYNESDEDLSEEEGDDLAAAEAGGGVVAVVPGVVVLILAAILTALSYRFYRRHRRRLADKCSALCACCPATCCAPAPVTNTNHHLKRDQLSQIEADESESETEL